MIYFDIALTFGVMGTNIAFFLSKIEWYLANNWKIMHCKLNLGNDCSLFEIISQNKQIKPLNFYLWPKKYSIFSKKKATFVPITQKVRAVSKYMSETTTF